MDTRLHVQDHKCCYILGHAVECWDIDQLPLVIKPNPATRDGLASRGVIKSQLYKLVMATSILTYMLYV